MSFFDVEDSSLIVSHVLYKAALIYAVVRWALSFALRFRNRNISSSSNIYRENYFPSLSICQSQMILSKYGDISDSLMFPESCDTCSVCLAQLRDHDEVRQLRNCCHVFHKECIDKWIDHGCQSNNKSCPLCRTPLVLPQQASSGCGSTQPSWAVDRLLYLFGDDLYA